jgi:hypothetical protein
MAKLFMFRNMAIHPDWIAYFEYNPKEGVIIVHGTNGLPITYEEGTEEDFRSVVANYEETCNG